MYVQIRDLYICCMFLKGLIDFWNWRIRDTRMKCRPCQTRISFTYFWRLHSIFWSRALIPSHQFLLFLSLCINGMLLIGSFLIDGIEIALSICFLSKVSCDSYILNSFVWYFDERFAERYQLLRFFTFDLIYVLVIRLFYLFDRRHWDRYMNSFPALVFMWFTLF